MATTARHQIPTPDLTAVPNIPADLLAMAQRIDDRMGTFVVTSTTRPGSPFTGQVIYETDTGSTAIWTGSAWAAIRYDVPNPSIRMDLIAATGYTNGAWMKMPFGSPVASQTVNNGDFVVDAGNRIITLVRPGAYHFSAYVAGPPDLAAARIVAGNDIIATGKLPTTLGAMTLSMDHRVTANTASTIEMFHYSGSPNTSSASILHITRLSN